MNKFDERVEAAAEAMDKNFNPDKYPVMAAMFRDYAAVGIEAADAVVTEEQIAEALHGDACPDDPDEGDTCSCDGADFRRQASVVAALVTGGAK